MRGLAYHRNKQCMTRYELSEKVGIHQQSLASYETPGYKINCAKLLKLSDALGVSMDELVRDDYPDIAHYRKPLSSRTSNADNPVSRYRDVNLLTFQQLATRLGRTTREAGRKACSGDRPLRNHVERLARYEGVTPQQFLEQYSSKEVN